MLSIYLSSSGGSVSALLRAEASYLVVPLAAIFLYIYIYFIYRGLPYRNYLREF